MGTRQQYTEEFKLEAVRLWIASGRKRKEVAEELGITPYFLGKWRAQFERRTAEYGGRLPTKPGEVFPGTGHLSSKDDEIVRLKRELAVVTEEREILKKATAFFAKLSR